MRSLFSVPVLVLFGALLTISAYAADNEVRVNGQMAPRFMHDSAMPITNGQNYSAGYAGEITGTDFNYGYPSYGEGLLPTEAKQGRLFYWDGWISAGAESNSNPPITTSAVSGDPTYPGNEDASNFQMNQLYGILGIDAARNPSSFGIGGRVDFLYGTDYLMTSSIGLESERSRRATAGGGPAESIYEAGPHWNKTKEGGYPQYGVALPQAYAEFYAPILAGTSIKVGHYYSPLGYESVMSPYNFFYSHSYSMLYGQSKTLTGVLVSQKLNDNWTALIGVDRGWDTWEGYENDTSITAGFKWANAPCPEDVTSSISFAIQSGKQAVEAQEVPFDSGNYLIKKGDMFNYSLVYQQKLGPSLQYVLEHNFGKIEDGAADIDVQRYMSGGNLIKYSNAYWYSLTNYLFYQINEQLSIGARFEWFKDEGHSRWLSYPAFSSFRMGDGNYLYKLDGDNYFNVSLGLNWKPTRWITVRPEVRYDWATCNTDFYNGTPNVQSSSHAYKLGKESELVTVGGDVNVRF